MFSDYGKRAYVKVIELEKRFEQLKKELQSSTIDVLSFDLTTPERRAVFSQKAYFTCKNAGNIVVNLEVNTDLSVPLNYQVIVNGKIIKSGTSLEGKCNLKIETGVLEGDCVIQTNLSASMTFSIKNFYVSVSGKVKYYQSERRISYATVNGVNYVSFLNNDRVILYSYDNNLGLFSLYELSDVKDACIAGFINGELYLLYITSDNKIKVLIYDPEEYAGFIYGLNVNGATSVCGYPVDNKIKVIYVVKGEVFVGTYEKGLQFYSEQTKRRGTKVTCDCDCVGAYVITGAFNSNKLIIEN